MRWAKTALVLPWLRLAADPRLVRSLRAGLAVVGLVAAALVPGRADADIYSYTDAEGVIHFANRPGSDARFKLYLKAPDRPKKTR